MMEVAGINIQEYLATSGDIMLSVLGMVVGVCLLFSYSHGYSRLEYSLISSVTIMIISGPSLLYGSISVMILSSGLLLIQKKSQDGQPGTWKIVTRVLWSTAMVDLAVLIMFIMYLLLYKDRKAVFYLIGLVLPAFLTVLKIHALLSGDHGSIIKYTRYRAKLSFWPTILIIVGYVVWQTYITRMYWIPFVGILGLLIYDRTFLEYSFWYRELTKYRYNKLEEEDIITVKDHPKIKRVLSTRSDRVKSCDLHPTEPWLLTSLSTGNVHIWNYLTQKIVRRLEVCDWPVRAAIFVARKGWVVTASDDGFVRVFDQNIQSDYSSFIQDHSQPSFVTRFQAHSDYMRSIAAHPTHPLLLTCGDDMLVKVWNWENNWECQQVLKGHTHYVMAVKIHPRDTNVISTASLDKTVKVWELGTAEASATLQGHTDGVNCVEFYSHWDEEKNTLISGADDRIVKIWDCKNNTCINKLQDNIMSSVSEEQPITLSHKHNVSCVSAIPELSIILTGSEDGIVKIWSADNYRLECKLDYGLGRVWSITSLAGSSYVALGYDYGAILVQLHLEAGEQLGEEENNKEEKILVEESDFTENPYSSRLPHLKLMRCYMFVVLFVYFIMAIIES